ncbi:hypothetical protein RvY_02869-2 [Ramazzottius varieornatus]|uniref:CCHC-type domain-containing protein n=1 Tax=Ramazzottius varieornatus TaxID=947166 RepID=A0A1D1UWC2_RAMVA|nr:hypothetical protein RvY_02869-2 [Ramazzottius varieornatus]
MASPILAYSVIIRGLALRKPDVRFWLEYDQRFRQEMSLPDSDVTGWYHEDRDIVRAVKNNFKPTATTTTVIRTVARGPYAEWIRTATCHICSEKGHIATTCPSKKEVVSTNPVAALNHVIRTMPITVRNASNPGIPSSPIATLSVPSTSLAPVPVTTHHFTSVEIPDKAYTPLIPERFVHALKDYPDSEFADYFNNFTLRITHISGVDNTLADAVSRFDNARFFENYPKANTEPIMVDNILDFLREIMLEPGNCSNSMRDRESSSVSDWLPLPEEATEMDLSGFALSV